MRRFTYASGTSHKFWSIDRDGSTVTVHFGRVGTAGQTQVKDLASDSEAEAHVTTLVAQKLKKGYAEDAADTVPTASVEASPSRTGASSDGVGASAASVGASSTVVIAGAGSGSGDLEPAAEAPVAEGTAAGPGAAV